MKERLDRESYLLTLVGHRYTSAGDEQTPDPEEEIPQRYIIHCDGEMVLQQFAGHDSSCSVTYQRLRCCDWLRGPRGGQAALGHDQALETARSRCIDTAYFAVGVIQTLRC